MGLIQVSGKRPSTCHPRAGGSYVQHFIFHQRHVNTPVPVTQSHTEKWLKLLTTFLTDVDQSSICIHLPSTKLKTSSIIMSSRWTQTQASVVKRFKAAAILLVNTTGHDHSFNVLECSLRLLKFNKSYPQRMLNWFGTTVLSLLAWNSGARNFVQKLKMSCIPVSAKVRKLDTVHIS